jgi:hypothetical protein
MMGYVEESIIFFVFDTQYSSWNVPCGKKPLRSYVITHSKNTSSDYQEISANFSLENGPKLPYVNGKREMEEY